MNEDDQLMEYLAICKAIYERMEAEGTWPWAEDDSTESEDLLESETYPNEL